ncbi:mannitol-1-phosphate 5-dehydrogenase [Cryobacterium tepidiphilum]|uniref:Mannitol-1-phosphate 5-dehydrogenase n=1 Tax=Cryobacterium tepidiphilum TaxID=2486026 RepID=A0A3M8LG94_9MICO|nr:mannitol-1-phosphate 5-dehydrogenase [Cryobacterium tepidiphilum]RNE63939.1 mannitol-1-phosphate 5-dehydrogenase [Cryobacterium tepidiphilum]
MKAVHFGAGNIGRGFVGLLLHEAGYEVVFADVNAALIDALNAADTYSVHEVGEEFTTTVVDRFRAVNSADDPEALVAEIASADVVTTAVGPTVLAFVAPAIADGIRRRDAALPPLVVMACENAINATDRLADFVFAHIPDAERAALAGRVVFANTAVDRIVPGQPAAGGIDVTVEPFYEWVIEKSAFPGEGPRIPGATFVDDLEPYIERKLFTVNTGHATIAYFGFLAGATTIAEALSVPAVAEAARNVLEETSALLVAKHGLDEDAQRVYREKILGRFANPALPDTVERVGRAPLRKLGRQERFIKPAAELAEAGTRPVALLAAVAALLQFDVPADEESVTLQQLRGSLPAGDFVTTVCGLGPAHPLFADLVKVVAATPV